MRLRHDDGHGPIIGEEMIAGITIASVVGN